MSDVKVTVDLGNVKRKLSPEGFNKGKFALANQALADMNQFVPRKKGTLRTTGHVTSENSILYQTPYAKAQFYGSNGKATFSKYSTPGTGKRWDLKAKSMFMPMWKKAFIKGASL